MAGKKRLINAYELREILDADECVWFGSSVYFPNWQINACIASCPTVDAVEVVRCKDCKYDGRCSIQDAMNWTPRTEITDAFCSYGERKEDETDQR